EVALDRVIDTCEAQESGARHTRFPVEIGGVSGAGCRGTVADRLQAALLHKRVTGRHRCATRQHTDEDESEDQRDRRPVIVHRATVRKSSTCTTYSPTDVIARPARTCGTAGIATR